jgi:hypothetical protein
LIHDLEEIAFSSACQVWLLAAVAWFAESILPSFPSAKPIRKAYAHLLQ